MYRLDSLVLVTLFKIHVHVVNMFFHKFVFLSLFFNLYHATKPEYPYKGCVYHTLSMTRIFIYID